jgi:hypothetical protein
VSLAGSAATVTPPADTSKLDPGVAVGGGGLVNIPGLKSVQFGQAGQPEVVLSGADLTIGDNTKVTYTFSSGDPITVTAIVEPNSGLWANYNPNGTNTASPSASATGTGTAIPTGTASATAGASVPATVTGSASPQNTVGSDTASGSATPSSTQ